MATVGSGVSATWLSKMEAASASATLSDLKATEIVYCGNNAIKNASANELAAVTHAVYTFYMTRAKEIMDDIWLGIATKDASLRKMYLDMTASPIFLKVSVPDAYISGHEDIQNAVVELANKYSNVCVADVMRIKSNGHYLYDDAIATRRNMLEKLMSGLPADKRATVNQEGAVANNSKSGCYVATCVYGSYDCPEVWTLRRFRDYTLDETWYGRLFIKCYYAVSPTIVKLFGDTKWFKTFWKKRLDKMVSTLNDNGIANTAYTDKY